MKSIEIINYIDSLNEDAYSKYTVGQLYTKLGHDRFIKYIKSCMEATIRRLTGGDRFFKFEEKVLGGGSSVHLSFVHEKDVSSLGRVREIFTVTFGINSKTAPPDGLFLSYVIGVWAVNPKGRRTYVLTMSESPIVTLSSKEANTASEINKRFLTAYNIKGGLSVRREAALSDQA